MQTHRLVLLALAAILGLAARAEAQVGQRITDVIVRQEGQLVTDPAVLGLVETTVGEPLSMADVRETIAQLLSLGRYDDVQASTESFADGVRVLYTLVPLHPIDRVELRGRLGIPQGELRRIIRDRFGDAPPPGRVRDVVDLLRAVYRQRGFAQARIAAHIEETHAPDRAALVVEVDAGPRARIAEVRVVRNDLDEQDGTRNLPAVTAGGPYDAAAIDRELRQWEERLRAAGYYEARGSHTAAFSPDGSSVVVTLNLRRGPRVVVAFAGDPIPERERDRLVPIREEASADEDLLEDAARAIERYLFAQGYRDASVTYVQDEGPDLLEITFHVERGPRHVVGDVRVVGAQAMSPADVRAMLPLKPGEPFVQASLDAGTAAILSAYRTAGFIDAQVTPQIEVLPPSDAGGARRVNATLRITEGARTLVGSVSFTGHTVLTEAQLRALTTVAPGAPFSQVEVIRSRERIELEYRNRGYESAVVDAEVARSADGRLADIVFRVFEGVQSLVDDIIIVGNERTSSETIRRELRLRRGEPLGLGALIESRARLAELGLFRRVEIEPLQQPGDPRRDVLVRVEELNPTTFGLGGGLEAGITTGTTEAGEPEDRFELAPRGFLEVGRRNLWGRNRSVNLFTRVALRPRDIFEGGRPVPGSPENGYGFNEYRVVGSFREPRVLDTRADLQVIGILEQAKRTSFNFVRREVRAEAGLALSRVYRLLGRYSFQRTELFDETFGPDDEEQPLIDRLFPQVRLSKFAGSLVRDTRDDLLDPSRGSLTIVDVDMAARALGSEVGFIKTLVQGAFFHQLPSQRRTIFGVSVRVGAAHGFPREVPRLDEAGHPVLGPDGAPIVDRVDGLPASERFFAGGATSVRGFALDRLANERTTGPTGFPTGGNGVIVVMSELRVNMIGDIDGAGFFDVGNVFARASDFDLADMRPAAGVGLRYRSPIGPVRVDVGFNLDRRELVPGRLERGVVWHFSLGQAF